MSVTTRLIQQEIARLTSYVMKLNAIKPLNYETAIRQTKADIETLEKDLKSYERRN